MMRISSEAKPTPTSVWNVSHFEHEVTNTNRDFSAPPGSNHSLEPGGALKSKRFLTSVCIGHLVLEVTHIPYGRRTRVGLDTDTYGVVRKESAGDLNSPVIRWLSKFLMVNSTASASSPGRESATPRIIRAGAHAARSSAL
eukprot:1195576-Prorocentrum_minimum.AAC.12